VLVYVPNRMEVSGEDFRLNQFEYAMKERHWDRGRVLERLRGMASCIPLLDLTPALRRATGG
jgi:hypothetical protein